MSADEDACAPPPVDQMSATAHVEASMAVATADRMRRMWALRTLAQGHPIDVPLCAITNWATRSKFSTRCRSRRRRRRVEVGSHRSLTMRAPTPHGTSLLPRDLTPDELVAVDGSSLPQR